MKEFIEQGWVFHKEYDKHIFGVYANIKQARMESVAPIDRIQHINTARDELRRAKRYQEYFQEKEESQVSNAESAIAELVNQRESEVTEFIKTKGVETLPFK